MSTSAPVYVLDANVLIQAHRLYYAFPICPGFWDCLLQHHQAGRILSIDKVRAQARNRVPLPNVCLQFGIPYIDTFTMLKELGGRFVLET